MDKRLEKGLVLPYEKNKAYESVSMLVSLNMYLFSL